MNQGFKDLDPKNKNGNHLFYNESLISFINIIRLSKPCEP